MLGYYLLRAKENIYSKFNRYGKYHLLYQKGEYYVGVLDGADIKVYNELDNAEMYHWFGCFKSNPDCRYHFEVIEQAAVPNKKEFYKIRMDLRHPVGKQFREYYNRDIIHRFEKKEIKEEKPFNEILPDAIRQVVIGELIQKAIKNTPYDDFYKKNSCLPRSRYVDDKVIKFLLEEREAIIKRHNKGEIEC